MLLIPAALAVLITIHLAMIMRQHHSQFPGPGRRERNVVGTPMWPAYALRSIGLLFAVAAVLFLLGGLDSDQPDLAVGAVSPVPVRERRPAGLVHRLADRRAAPDAQLGARDRRSHGDPQSVLGRRGVPAVRVRRDVRLAGDRAQVHRRPPPPRPARPSARPPDPHRDRRRLPQLGRDRVRGRLDRPDLLPPGHLLHDADPRVAGRHLDHSDHRVLLDPERVPVASAQRGAPAAGLAGRRWCAAGPTAPSRWSATAPIESSRCRPSRRSAPCPGTNNRPGGAPAAPPARTCALQALLRLAARGHDRVDQHCRSERHHDRENPTRHCRPNDREHEQQNGSDVQTHIAGFTRAEAPAMPRPAGRASRTAVVTHNHWDGAQPSPGRR